MGHMVPCCYVFFAVLEFLIKKYTAELALWEHLFVDDRLESFMSFHAKNLQFIVHKSKCLLFNVSLISYTSLKNKFFGHPSPDVVTCFCVFSVGNKLQVLHLQKMGSIVCHTKFSQNATVLQLDPWGTDYCIL